jgi:hypothetical protein
MHQIYHKLSAYKTLSPELAQVCSMAFVWQRTCVAILILLILVAQV